MAKITIHAVCVVEGEPLDVLEHYLDAVESLTSSGSAYGEVEVRVVAVEGVDFSFTPRNNEDRSLQRDAAPAAKEVPDSLWKAALEGH